MRFDWTGCSCFHWPSFCNHQVHCSSFWLSTQLPSCSSWKTLLFDLSTQSYFLSYRSFSLFIDLAKSSCSRIMKFFCLNLKVPSCFFSALHFIDWRKITSARIHFDFICTTSEWLRLNYIFSGEIRTRIYIFSAMYHNSSSHQLCPSVQYSVSQFLLSWLQADSSITKYVCWFLPSFSISVSMFNFSSLSALTFCQTHSIPQFLFLECCSVFLFPQKIGSFDFHILVFFCSAARFIGL